MSERRIERRRPRGRGPPSAVIAFLSQGWIQERAYFTFFPGGLPSLLLLLKRLLLPLKELPPSS
jgi:hypothetical protein